MARNSSIVLDIGANVDKTWRASLNNIGTDLNKVGKHISKNMEQYNKGADAIQKYQTEANKLHTILDNGDSTTMRYAEKMRYLTEQNQNLDASIEKSTERIQEFDNEIKKQQSLINKVNKGKYTEVLTDKDTRGILKKAKDEDFKTNVPQLEKQLSNLRNAYAQTEKKITETSNQITAQAGKKGVGELRTR